MAKFDPVNFVRQGALIASAMILIQHTEAACPKVAFFRQLYTQVITNKHEDVMAKYGAILAQGIIDAGGRNVTLSLQSRTGHTNLQAVVGMLVFTQYWYWFPLAHCLSLAFTPTCLIALNSDLKMPKIDFHSLAKPSLYAYPAPLEEKKREEREKVTTAVLSIAARAKRKDHDKKKEAQVDTKMDVDDDEKKEKKPVPTISVTSGPSKGIAHKSSDTTTDTTLSTDESVTSVKKEPEPNFEMLPNPARVMRQQLKGVTIPEGINYTPLKDVSIGGIVMVKHDATGDQTLVEPVAAFGPKPEGEEKEPEAPEAFEYLD
uniref:Putative 26s proteasome regulatory complex subunit rpn2/psmd1 n=1 Tax=Xenopsylla cheopis TaxID=163159 RepID=A0A6M2E2I3_XENCH